MQRLATQYRVATQYEGFDGETVSVPEKTLRSVLTALGADVTDDDAAQRSLAERETALWRTLLPPVLVTEAGAAASVPVTFDDGDTVRVRLWHEDDPDEVWELRPAQGTAPEMRRVDGTSRQRVAHALPGGLPLGWYRLEATTGSGESAEIDVAVTPQRLSTTDRLRRSRHWGYMAQLYSVVSSRSWGVGTSRTSRPWQP